MHELQFDKIWVIREAIEASTGEHLLIVENSTSGKSWTTHIPRGGDWDRNQIIKLFRTDVDADSGVCPLSKITALNLRMKQVAGKSNTRFALVMGTTEGEESPVFVQAFRNIELSDGDEKSLQVCENITAVDRIDLIAETAAAGYWFGREGSYPKTFTFVVASRNQGLLVSECFPEGPFQVMEAGVCGRFEFRLPFPVDTNHLRENCQFIIKAKGENAWMPRHVIALGVSNGESVLLGSRLNLDTFWMSTSSDHQSLLNLSMWG